MLFNKKNIPFIVILIFILIYRLWLLTLFGFKYTDTDQAVMWAGANDYAQGLFHEPRFYGQAYNSMLESLIAVPLIKIGVPIYQALPIITTLLTLLPYFILAYLTYIKKSKTLGLFILLFSFLLPIEYDLITSLSRGFVTGIALVSLTFIPILNKKENSLSFFLSLFFIVLGYSINPNSIILSLPLLLYYFLNNYKKLKFYIFSFLGATLALFLHFISNQFYINNPNYNLHRRNIKFSLDYFFEGIQTLDTFFNDLTPIFWKQGWTIVFIPIILAIIFLIQKKTVPALVSFITPIIILVPFCASRLYDGTDSVFYSFSRMFLAVPVLLVLLLSFLNFKNTKKNYLILILPISFGLYKTMYAKQLIDFNMSKNHYIGVVENEKLLKDCKKISQIAKKYNVGLIIANSHFYIANNYACETCEENFPKTLLPYYERRTWRLINDSNTIYNNIIIIDLARNLNEKFNLNRIEEDASFYLIKNNTLKTMEFIKKYEIDCRGF